MTGPLTDNRQLFDISIRLQVYLEGVKAQHARDFNFVLFKVREKLKELLGRVKYKNLDGLTKAELNRLVLSLRNAQSEIYSQYTQQLIKQLRDFMAVDMTVNRRVWATCYLGQDEPVSDEDAIDVLTDANKSNKFIPLFGLAAAIGTTGGDDRMWAAVMNTPLPANGLYLQNFIKGFSVSAQASVENLVRKAWANGWTLQETISEIAGSDAKQGTANQLQRINVQGQAVISTALQHVAATVTAGVSSVLFGRYQWHSVLDSGTTVICRSRNRKVYKYGEGPLPPAHIRCRSSVAPYFGNAETDDYNESFFAWIKRQPASIQNDALGKVNATKLRKGEIKAEDINSYETSNPLTLAEFAKKVLSILSR